MGAANFDFGGKWGDFFLFFVFWEGWEADFFFGKAGDVWGGGQLVSGPTPASRICVAAGPRKPPPDDRAFSFLFRPQIFPGCRHGQGPLLQEKTLARQVLSRSTPLPPLSGLLSLMPYGSREKCSTWNIYKPGPNTTQTQARRKVFSRYFPEPSDRLKACPKHPMGAQVSRS